MALNIQRSGRPAPLRVVIHGPPGAGKTSWAAAIPGCLFLTPPDEDGLGENDVPVQEVRSWSHLVEVVQELTAGAGGPSVRAVVVDTISTLERQLHAEICAEARVSSIEEVGGGYGKGLTAVGEAVTALMHDLEALRRRQGVNVVLLCHSVAQAFQDPAGAPYDQWQLQLSKKARGPVEAWADIIGCAHEVVTTGQRQEKRKVRSSRRELVLSGSAAYVCKTRLPLPESIPLGWTHFADALARAGRPWDAHRAPAAPVAAPSPLNAALRARLQALKAAGCTVLVEPAGLREAMLQAIAEALGAPPTVEAVEALPLDKLQGILVGASILAAPELGGEE